MSPEPVNRVLLPSLQTWLRSSQERPPRFRRLCGSLNQKIQRRSENRSTKSWCSRIKTIRIHRAQLREIVARHGAPSSAAFGSAVHGNDTDESDLDLLVDPTAQATLMTLAAIQLEAERLLGVRVDVVTLKESSTKIPRSSAARSRSSTKAETPVDFR